MVFDIVPNGPRRHPGCCCLRLEKPWEQCGRAGLWKRGKVYSTGYFVSQTYPTRGCFRGRGCGRDESVLTRRITSNPVSRKAKANRNGWPTSTSHVTTTVLISTLLHADEEGPARQQKKTAAMERISHFIDLIFALSSSSMGNFHFAHKLLRFHSQFDIIIWRVLSASFPWWWWVVSWGRLSAS